MSVRAKQKNSAHKRKSPEKPTVTFASDSEEDDMFEGMEEAENAAAMAQQLKVGKKKGPREWEQTAEHGQMGLDVGGDEDEDEDGDEEDVISAEELQKSLKAATATVSNKLTRSQRKKLNADILAQENAETDQTGVVYFGHLPYGFFEKQMRVFFRQFGRILNLRISRDPKTGKSRHYAFIEFANRDVAEIVAENMDGYMMFGKSLVTRLLSPEEVHEKMFEGANRVYHPKKWRIVARGEHNKERDDKREKKRLKRIKRGASRRQKELSALGIDYELDEAITAEQIEGKPNSEVKDAVGSGVWKSSRKKSPRSSSQQGETKSLASPSNKQRRGQASTSSPKAPPPTPATPTVAKKKTRAKTPVSKTSSKRKSRK